MDVLREKADKFFSNPFKKPNVSSESKRKDTDSGRMHQEALRRENSIRNASARSQQPAAASSSGAPKSYRRLEFGARKKLTTEECLSAVQSLLDQLRQVNPNDVHAFPLLNESQRLVQQLRETPSVQQGPDKDAWLFQIGELQDEVRGQTERLMSSASSMTQPESQQASGPGFQQALAVASTISMHRQAAVQPSGTPLSAPGRPALQRVISRGGSGSGVPAGGASKGSQAQPAWGQGRGTSQQQQQQQFWGAGRGQQQGQLGTIIKAQPGGTGPLGRGTGGSSTPAWGRAAPVLAQGIKQTGAAAAAAVRGSTQPPQQQQPLAFPELHAAADAEDDLFSGLSLSEDHTSGSGSGVAAPTGQAAAAAVAQATAGRPVPDSNHAAEVAAVSGHSTAKTADGTGAGNSGRSAAAAAAAGASISGISPLDLDSEPLIAFFDSGPALSCLSTQPDVAACSNGNDPQRAELSLVSQPDLADLVGLAVSSSGTDSQRLNSVSSWSASMTAAAWAARDGCGSLSYASGVEVGAPPDGDSGAVFARSGGDGDGQRGVKKKMRGIGVGYGVEEDLHGAATAAHPASAFSPTAAATLAAAAATAAAAPPSRRIQSTLLPGTGTSSFAKATSAAPRAAAPSPVWLPAQEPVRLAPEPRRSGSAATAPAASAKPSTSGESAARRLNLPSGGFTRSRSISRNAVPAPAAASAPTPTPAPAPAPASSLPLTAALPASPGSTHPDSVSLAELRSPVAAAGSPVPSLLLVPRENPTPLVPQALGASPPPGPFLVQPRRKERPEAEAQAPVSRYGAYLDGLAGPLDACLQSAAEAAEQLVQQLEAEVAWVTQRERGARAARRSHATEAGAAAATADQLERQLATAAEAEDYGKAASLVDQVAGLRERASVLGALALQAEQEARQLVAQRLKVVDQQAQVWDCVTEYLQRLVAAHSGQALAWEEAEAQLSQRDGLLLQEQHQQAAASIAQARTALDIGKIELVAARAEVESRAKLASGPMCTERDRLSAMQADMQGEVQRLRRLLADHEQQLAQTTEQLLAAETQVQQATEAFAPKLSAVQVKEAQLQVQQADLEAREALLASGSSQAHQRRQAAEEHRRVRALEAQALAGRAVQAADRAAEVSRRTEFEAVEAVERQALADKEAAARESQAGLSKCLEDMATELAACTSRCAHLAADLASLRQQVEEATRSLPDLEAAKKAAAARKDFKDAAILSAEAKAVVAQSEGLVRKTAAAQAAVGKAAEEEAGKLAEMEELRAMVPEVQRDMVAARHSFLRHCIHHGRRRVESASHQERYEEAQQLQADLDADVAEAARLLELWGLPTCSSGSRESQPLGAESRDSPPTSSSPTASPQTAHLKASSSPSTATTAIPAEGLHAGTAQTPTEGLGTAAPSGRIPTANFENDGHRTIDPVAAAASGAPCTASAAYVAEASTVHCVNASAACAHLGNATGGGGEGVGGDAPSALFWQGNALFGGNGPAPLDLTEQQQLGVEP